MQGTTNAKKAVAGSFDPSAYLFGKAEPEADLIRIEPAAFVGVGGGFSVYTGPEL